LALSGYVFGVAMSMMLTSGRWLSIAAAIVWLKE